MSGIWLASYVALWLLVGFQAVLLLLLYRHFGMMSLGTLEGVQRDGLPVGTAAPAISGITAEGDDRAWEPKRGRPQLLVFATPDCEPCATVLPVIGRLVRSPAGAALEVAAVVPGPRAEVARLVGLYAPPFPCLAEDGSGAFTRFRVRVTPFAFVVGSDGRILAKGLCGDGGRLRDLFQAAGLPELAAAIPPAGKPVRLTPPAAVAARGGANNA